MSTDFARGYRLGAMMMREQASQLADDEAVFAAVAEECADSGREPIMSISLPDYWRLRVGNARVLADRIYHLPILEKLP